MSNFIRTNLSRYYYGMLYVSKEDIAHLLCGGVITCTQYEWDDNPHEIKIALEEAESEDKE